MGVARMHLDKLKIDQWIINPKSHLNELSDQKV